MNAAAAIALLKTIKHLGTGLLRRATQTVTRFEEIGLGRLPSRLQRCQADRCPVCSNSAQNPIQKRLVYLVSASNLPSGGNKVIYRHVELAQRDGLAVEVMHPERPAGFRYRWFEHAVIPLADDQLCPSRDHLVLPEVWAALGTKFCKPAGFAYSIFVQNGYLLHLNAGFTQAMLREAYTAAEHVVAISDDSAAMVSRAYPSIAESRIFRVVASISRQFKPAPAKAREITFLRRKLRSHSERVEAYLQPLLPAGWSLIGIENASEAGVAALFARSAIFLSFSELEGLGLPPLEAALAGNRVVGYHGQGGKEYFDPPIFYPVACGDIHGILDQTLAAIADFEHNPQGTPDMLAQREALKLTYGAERERQTVLNFQHAALATPAGADPLAAPRRSSIRNIRQTN